MTRESVAVAGAPDEAGGRTLAGILTAHGIPAELRDAGSGFVDVVVPRKVRDEARKLLKAHFEDLAREGELVLVADAPEAGAGYGMVRALQAAGIPAVARHGRFGGTVCVHVPHRMAADATEFLAALEAQCEEEEVAGDELDQATPECEPTTAQADAPWSEDGANEPGAAEPADDLQADEADSAATKPADEAAQGRGAEPESEAEPADDGPPVYASDLKPDFGDAFGSPGGSF